MSEPCEFCDREPTDRFRPLERSTLEIVDCERCGVFAIGNAVSTMVLTVWTNEQRADERARIEQSNRSGYIHHVGRGDAIVDRWGLVPMRVHGGWAAATGIGGSRASSAAGASPVDRDERSFSAYGSEGAPAPDRT